MPDRVFVHFPPLKRVRNRLRVDVSLARLLDLQPKDYQRWLNPDNEDVADIIAPPPSEGWIAYPVNRRVNSPKNDDARQIEPES